MATLWTMLRLLRIAKDGRCDRRKLRVMDMTIGTMNTCTSMMRRKELHSSSLDLIVRQ
jgi:hypothetical protein